MQISGLVITLNEEKHIEECVRSLFRLCSEVIVVDSFSSDRTVEFAEKAGAKVVRQQFLGDGPQRSFGLQFCKNDWILNLDADERLDDDAVAEIKELDLAGTKYDAYELRRKNYLHGKWIKVADWYPDNVRRLFNRKKTDFAPLKTHTKITSKNFLRLRSHILHYSFGNYQDMLNILNRYTTWQSESMYLEKKRVSAAAPFLHGLFSFIKHYIFKRGFMAGMEGLSISMLIAMGSYFKYAKLIELYAKRECD